MGIIALLRQTYYDADWYTQQEEEVNLSLEAYFTEAKAYLENPALEHRNLKFEAMRPLFEGQQRLFIEARRAKEILHALKFIENYELQAVIVDGRDAWMVAAQLKAQEVPVILRATQSLPSRVDEAIDQPFRTPAMLQEAGVLFCFSQDGFWQQRNLHLQAGQAVGYGLDYEDAIAALTGNTAKILGIEDRSGTLEVGKDANFFIAEGDVLDVRTSEVSQAFIQGRVISLDNVQKRLYRKFKAKYDADR